MIDISGIAPENQPAEGSAPGWPLVLYFHHIHPDLKHYTSITPDELRMGLDLVLEHFAPLDPSLIGQPRPTRPHCLFTFDDGYADNLTHAAPILAERNIKAIVFGTADQTGRRSTTNVRDNFLTLPEYSQLRKEGHYIGAHTMSHRRLDTLEDHEAREEVSDSIDWAGQFHGGTSNLFAFPYGVVPIRDVVPDGVWGFGTVRCEARSWDAYPHTIRRTYLPTNSTELWKPLIKGWSQQWMN